MRSMRKDVKTSSDLFKIKMLQIYQNRKINKRQTINSKKFLFVASINFVILKYVNTLLIERYISVKVQAFVNLRELARLKAKF